MAGRRITFGWHLDGQRATQPADSLGASVVGPLGFLNILETQLGLLALHPSQAERIVQYRDCLQKLDNDQRFYHWSFATDPLGTAACLLDWRDQWILHGWNGTMADEAPKRLRDLIEVESLANTAVSPNIGQRLNAVHQALQHRKPDVEQVQLVDSAETFPARWQMVLAALPIVGPVALQPAGQGFLKTLQQQLQAAATGQTPKKLPWQDDGSVLVVQAETTTLAALWLSTQLAVDRQTLLVSGGDGARLDAMLAAACLPRQGLKEASAFRPALQVLPLVLELLWDPPNFYALVQFLTHSVCPIRGYARRRLAEKVADAPGIGGAYWQRTLAEIDKHYGAEQAPKVREQIAAWIEHTRFPSEFGAPLDAVIERVERLADFFRQRLGEPDTAQRLAFHAGFGQCKACLESLKGLQAQGANRIRPRQLQKLVAQATANGSDNPLWPAEVGAGQVVSQPGAVIEPVERVIWWRLAMPVLPGSDPWSASEVRALRQAGTVLAEVADRLDRAAHDWLRPMMAAQEQLVLVLPPPGEEVHPLWQMIGAVVDQARTIDLETLLLTGAETMTAVASVPLPAPKRWWQLPDDVAIALRPKESFSSLEQLLFNPNQWLLRYPAKLQPSRIVSMGGDFRMLGNLAHGLIEQYFLHPSALVMSEAEFDVWFAESFSVLVDQEGAILRSPGRGADLEGFRYRLHHSMRSLRYQVAKAGMVQVLPERGVAGQFPGGELAGSADLVMRNGRGERAIVDMKWSGIKKFPDKLKRNRHLQLAIYAELLRQETGAWPSVAYYILDRARFLAPDDRAFPDAEVVPSADGENTAQLWQRFLATWRWRVAQIQSGQIEVVLDAIPATEDSEPPAEAMTMETLNEAYNDYRALAGWER
ncbi:MAG: PD-(D/E)XK nuclease family protein [Candidatus Accumulibacter sp.]|uniref:PD-(D/E)XK nuclease family protein n=1 Tax=Candidatus Accumulibacter cognatus TaxID=2954383 RepID=A0A7D5SC22_9PROT|nr:PD-(D/E)XK nuclease family protein [Accumulibacter sp.]MBN8519683.1 PD-(D/E)XK nuclease family protein [Accumulibacter sp.]MBO3709637.1 PD-(D/E)XK nuclease family protein [Accumulibacter sp.]QLH48902.1 MAG: PD-(D/E)XK nuclease family protein [Candidatus Accumulibacter cognatus]